MDTGGKTNISHYEKTAVCMKRLITYYQARPSPVTGNITKTFRYSLLLFICRYEEL